MNCHGSIVRVLPRGMIPTTTTVPPMRVAFQASWMARSEPIASNA
jgi:hypothetical protein